jgi:hypothetical protein
MLQELHNSAQICSAWIQSNLVMVCLAWFVILMGCLMLHATPEVVV